MRAGWLAAFLLVIACRSDDKRGAKVPESEDALEAFAEEQAKLAAKRQAARQIAEQSQQSELVEQRRRMVADTIEARGITDKRVLTAMQVTPRHELVPPAIRDQAYEDRALPIGFGLTISQPYIVAAMTEAARVKPGDKVLEIGTGSGYQAAVLALMGAKVYTIEIHDELAARTQAVFDRIGFKAIQLKVADGWFGWPDAAPFDAILVTCATPILPDRLFDQLKVGGRMVAPIGDDYAQVLQVITKTGAHEREEHPLMDVRFGLMKGAVEAER